MPETLLVALVGAVIILIAGLGWLITARLLHNTRADHARSQVLLRKLTQAVEQSPATVMITDLKGAIEYVNPKFIALTGYTPAEVIGKNPRILNSGYTSDDVYHDMWQTISSGHEWRGEFLNRKKNGELYWEYASISPVKDDKGRITHYVAVKEDITARKEAEEALRASEAKQDAFLSAIPDLVFRFDRDGVYLDVRGNTERGLRVVDEEPEETVGKTLHDLLPQDKADLLTATIRRTLDTGETQTVEYTLETLSGSMYFEARMVPIGPNEVLSAARDITDRRTLEAALRESEEKYRNVSERANDGIVIVQDSRVQYCNRPLAHMVGHTVEDLTGRSFGDLLAPETRDTVLGYYQKRILGATVPTRFEAQLQHARGRAVDVEFNSGVMLYEGRPAALIIIRDIRARKQAEAEREHLIHELREFAHTVAHDLKSPLHGMIGYASLLAEDPTAFDPEELRRHLKIIENYGFRMSRIIDDLLLLASVRSLAEVDQTQIDMVRAAKEALIRLDFMVQDCEAQVTVADDMPAAWGYLPWVTQVWVNYLSNALKYGGEKPQIVLGAGPHRDGMHRFWVRDHGPGIAPEQQKRLFTRFSRVGELSIEGHGLGLSIVQRIVDRLGGEVGVVSDVDQGAEFWFTLPAAAPRTPLDTSEAAAVSR